MEFKNLLLKLLKQDTLVIVFTLLIIFFFIIGLIIFIPTYRITGMIMKPFVWLYKKLY